MDRKEIADKVLGILKPFVKNQEALATVTEQTSILNDLKVNSARLVDIILAFEDEYGIAIDDESADKVRTIGDAVNLITAKLGAQPA